MWIPSKRYLKYGVFFVTILVSAVVFTIGFLSHASKKDLTIAVLMSIIISLFVSIIGRWLSIKYIYPNIYPTLQIPGDDKRAKKDIKNKHGI
jgi:uncharacterized membrane protein YwaF